MGVSTNEDIVSSSLWSFASESNTLYCAACMFRPLEATMQRWLGSTHVIKCIYSILHTEYLDATHSKLNFVMSIEW